MGNSRRVLALLFAALTCGTIRADDSVSAAFTFDARYPTSGLTPADWEAHEAVELSERFAAATVVRVVDLNGNGIADGWEAFYGLAGERATADADPDGDGRTNLQEYNAGTNPVLAEDYLAAVAESGPWTADTWIASTAGGEWTLLEVWSLSERFATDTAGRVSDADKDGLPDEWELRHGLDPYVADAHLDPDGDGRTNLQEYNAGTNPLIADDWTKAVAESDDPFVTDTRVWSSGGDPTMGETFEVVLTSNGFICDTGGLYYDWDGDGIPNWWEKRFARDGSKTSLVATADDDRDGMSNYGEFVAYTDPTDCKSKFVVDFTPIQVRPLKLAASPSSVAESAPGFVVSWQSAVGRSYSIWTTADLAKGWGVEPYATVEGTGAVVERVVRATGGSLFVKVTVALANGY